LLAAGVYRARVPDQGEEGCDGEHYRAAQDGYVLIA
jgi:hypothetical protein